MAKFHERGCCFHFLHQILATQSIRVAKRAETALEGGNGRQNLFGDKYRNARPNGHNQQALPAQCQNHSHHQPRQRRIQVGGGAKHIRMVIAVRQAYGT